MKTKSISIKNILYTTDLSDTALHAFSYAVSLANLYNATITVLHVIGDDARNIAESRLITSGFLTQDEFEKISQQHTSDARESLTGKKRSNVIFKDALNRFAENVKEDEDSQAFTTDRTLVLFGDAVEKIIETSKALNSDLIVMGAHGYGFLQDLLGSTTRKVLRKSKIPVMVVRLDG